MKKLDNHIETYVLSNGLRIIHRNFPSEISYCGIAVNTGARDERPEEYGMAHFVEHMLFKGTSHRKAHHIASRMENVGGDLNAYTTKEETFVYATFLKEYFPRAVELLSDIIFNSELLSKQIERERTVVLDEIDSYEDSPSDLIFDDFENFIYDGHALGHNILGYQETLMDFNEDNLKDFMRRHYQPNNMIFFSFGNTPFSKVVKQVERYFEVDVEPAVGSIRIAPPYRVPSKKNVEKNTMQTHVMLGWYADSLYAPQKIVYYFINNLLGGGSVNSRLNSSIREKHGLAYNVESNVALYSDTGFFSIYFATDPKNKDKCIKLINKEIARLKEERLRPMQLTTAKRQWKGHLGIASEINENSALNMARSFLHLNKYSSIEEIFDKIDKISSDQIIEMANRLFSEESFELIYQKY